LGHLMWGNRKKGFELKSRNSKHQIANRKQITMTETSSKEYETDMTHEERHGGRC